MKPMVLQFYPPRLTDTALFELSEGAKATIARSPRLAGWLAGLADHERDRRQRDDGDVDLPTIDWSDWHNAELADGLLAAMELHQSLHDSDAAGFVFYLLKIFIVAANVRLKSS